MSKTLHEWFDEYGQSHRHPTNKIIHLACVPLIFFSTIALLWTVPLGPLPRIAGPELGAWLNLGTVGLIGALLFYARLSWPVFWGASVFSGASVALCVWLQNAQIVPLRNLAGAVFVVAWIGQFIGHKIEGKKPSFMKDLQFLLVGPAWVLHFVYEKLGIRLVPHSPKAPAMKQ